MEDFSRLFPDDRQSGKTTLGQAQRVMLRMLKVVGFICDKHRIPYWICSGTLLGAVRHGGFIPWDDDLDIAMLREDYERFLAVAADELPADMFLQTKENEPTYDELTLPCKIRDTKSRILSPYLDQKKYHRGLFIDIFPFDRFHRQPSKLRTEKFLKRTNNILCKCFDAAIGQETSRMKRILVPFRPFFGWLLGIYRRITTSIIRRNKQLPDDACFVGHGFDTPWFRQMRMDEIFPLQQLGFEDATFPAPCNTDAYLKYIYGDSYMTPPPEDQRQQPHSTVIKPIIEI